MNLESYIAKQKQLEQYRTNLDWLDERIANEGGEPYAPISVRNQRREILGCIERLEREIQQIELRMIEEIPSIRDAFKIREREIERLSSKISALEDFVSAYIEMDEAFMIINSERIMKELHPEHYDTKTEIDMNERIERLSYKLRDMLIRIEAKS
jgi:hypothetical protein